MSIAKLTEDLYVSPQIDIDALKDLKARGIRAVVSNRPDGEQADQPTSDEVEAAARAQGLEYRHIPVVSGQIGDAEVAAFAEALKALPGPVLAFCRSGTRSTSLWALANAATLGPDAVLKTAADAGYDLEGLKPRLADRAQAAAPTATRTERKIAGYDVVIVGGGAAGLAAACRLMQLAAKNEH